jgi:hypothetical protein
MPFGQTIEAMGETGDDRAMGTALAERVTSLSLEETPPMIETLEWQKRTGFPGV